MESIINLVLALLWIIMSVILIVGINKVDTKWIQSNFAIFNKSKYFSAKHQTSQGAPDVLFGKRHRRYDMGNAQTTLCNVSKSSNANWNASDCTCCRFSNVG